MPGIQGPKRAQWQTVLGSGRRWEGFRRRGYRGWVGAHQAKKKDPLLGRATWGARALTQGSSWEGGGGEGLERRVGGGQQQCPEEPGIAVWLNLAGTFLDRWATEFGFFFF